MFLEAFFLETKPSNMYNNSNNGSERKLILNHGEVHPPSCASVFPLFSTRAGTNTLCAKYFVPTSADIFTSAHIPYYSNQTQRKGQLKNAAPQKRSRALPAGHFQASVWRFQPGKKHFGGHGAKECSLAIILNKIMNHPDLSGCLGHVCFQN